jgi:putative membrane protein
VIETVADHFWHGGFGWFWIVGLLQPVFWIAVIALLVTVFRRRPPERPQPPAIALLEERYARGEISREEFLERRSVLRGDTPG